MAASIPEKRFRVIIVGAGITGLTLSHALTKAGIDHVVLERGDVAPHHGSSIGIHAHGSRVLDQLGCLEAVEKLCVPMKQFVNRLPDGRVLTSTDFFDFMKDCNGYNFLNLERRAFLQTMFDCLPDKSVIRTQRRITEIIEKESGIKVVLADGTEEYGDIVVGCDGVNSTVRQAIWANAENTIPGYITSKEKRTLQTSYTCLLGIAPTPVGLGTRDMTCVHGHAYSFLFLSQPDQVFFFVFSKLSRPTSWPNNQRWTDEDAEKVADGVKDHLVSDSLLFGEIWRTRIQGQLVSMEEGIFEQWHFGRMVLAGDAVHKVTPNFALGGNTGIESVTVLANELHRLVHMTPNGRPDKAAITAMFQRYQIRRLPRVRTAHFASWFITRLQAWDGIMMRCMAQWIVPVFIGDKMIAQALGYLVKDAPKLDFIPIESRKGTMGWNDEKAEASLMQLRSKGYRLWRPLVLAIACVLFLAWLRWPIGCTLAVS